MSALAHTSSLVLTALVALLGVGLCGCGGDDSTDEVAPTAASTETTAEPTPVLEAPPPSHWPRPIPPELYRVAEVKDPGALHGIVTAASDGHGVLFDSPPDAACPGEPFRTAAGPLAGAVLLLEGIVAGKALEQVDTQVNLGGCAVSPRVQLAAVGGTLRASSGDAQAHALQLILWDGHRDLGNLSIPGDGTEAERRLRLPGLVHLRCDEHLAARGWLWVMEHPYHTLSGADGSYRIEDIPPGRYVLHAWHEAYEPLVREVDIPEGGGDHPLDLVLGAP